MHLRQLPSGRWRVIVKAGGRRRTASADTRAGAQRVGARLLLDLGEVPSRSRVTVTDIISRYLAANEHRWSPTYLADVERVADQIPESFTDLRAGLVGPAELEALYHRLQRGGWSAHRLRRLHELLSAAWHDAMRLELVGRNPVALVRKPSAPPRDLIMPTHDDVVAVLAEATGPDEYLALWLAAILGARRGEIVALQWRDINLTAGTVVIRRDLVYSPASGITERGTKTGQAGHRVLDLDARTVGLLEQHQREQAARAAEKDQPAPRWVLSDDNGVSAWRPDRLTHVFAAARKRAKVHGVRLHDLRHYVATSKLEDGESVLDVANQLGHASPATTQRVYAHYMPGRGRDSAERRAARLTGR